MIEYRPFRNTDPPQLNELWNFGKLGPGAAREFPNDVFDLLVLAEPYFDKQGLICACDGKEVVGFVHAGFGSNAEGTGISTATGVICAVVVRMDYRMQGIGRQLIARAEDYLKSRGAGEIVAGESGARNPFYLGLYGGAESAGFLETDPNAAPFFTALGYQPTERYVLLRRDITEKKDPFDPRMLTVKRAMKFGVLDRPPAAKWWWMTRYGRFGSLTFALIPNAGGNPPAEVTFWEMQFHAACRGERTAGITDLSVSAGERRKGYAKSLITEVIRRLRDEMVTHVEVTIREDNQAALDLFRTLNFQPFDTGVVYRKSPALAGSSLHQAAESSTEPDQNPAVKATFESA
ncbi:MAG TPA: GNAT family N-acetyltransferase [Planctomycetaceae bacterium]